MLELSHGVAAGSDITSCNKIDTPLVVYRFSENVEITILTSRIGQNTNFFHAKI